MAPASDLRPQQAVRSLLDPAEVDSRLHGDLDPPQVNERGVRLLVQAVGQLVVAS